MPVITLPDGSDRQFERSVTPAEIAADIGPGLAKAAMAATVNGAPWCAINSCRHRSLGKAGAYICGNLGGGNRPLKLSV